MYASLNSNVIHSKIFIFANKEFNQIQFNLKSKIEIIKKIEQDLILSFDKNKLVIFETKDSTST